MSSDRLIERGQRENIHIIGIETSLSLSVVGHNFLKAGKFNFHASTGALVTMLLKVCGRLCM